MKSLIQKLTNPENKATKARARITKIGATAFGVGASIELAQPQLIEIVAAINPDFVPYLVAAEYLLLIIGGLTTLYGAKKVSEAEE